MIMFMISQKENYLKLNKMKYQNKSFKNKKISNTTINGIFQLISGKFKENLNKIQNGLLEIINFRNKYK